MAELTSCSWCRRVFRYLSSESGTWAEYYCTEECRDAADTTTPPVPAPDEAGMVE